MRTILLLLCVLILSAILLERCNEVENIKAELKREHNNYLASQDSIRIIKSEKNLLVVEKSSLELKLSELNGDQISILKQLQLFKKKNKTVKTVTQYVTVYKDSIRNIPSQILKNSDGSEFIAFNHEPKLPGKNKLKITGKVPFSFNLEKDPYDLSKYKAGITSGDVSLDLEQNIEISTGVYQDEKTKRIMTRLSTTYPGLSFSDVNSFDITDRPETKKLLRSARKKWGIGLNVGIDMTSISRGPNFVVGLGLNYSPKFLQFGK
jgi:hypothetical protein